MSHVEMPPSVSTDGEKAKSITATTARATGAARSVQRQQTSTTTVNGSVAGTPVNDDCANATVITGLGSVDFNNFSATTDGPNHAECNFSGDSGIALDVWYSWTAPLDCNVQIDTCGSTTANTKIAVYAGTVCPTQSTVPIACNDDACGLQSSVQFEAGAGQTFLIRLGARPGTLGGGGSFAVSCALCEEQADRCQGPSRDDADNSNGTDFASADSFQPASNGSVSEICWWGAYDDGVGDCQGEEQDRFIVTYYADLNGFPDPDNVLAIFRQETGSLNVSGPVPTGDFIEIVFDPTLPPLPITEYAFAATHTPVPVQAGQCYWVKITNSQDSANCTWYWEHSAAGDGRSVQDGDPLNGFGVEDVFGHDLSFCVDIPLSQPGGCLPPAPANDDCVSPIEVFEGVTSFESFGATTDGPAEPSCDFVLNDDQINRDIWFVHESTCDQSLQFSLCGSEFDTKIAVYGGTSCPPQNLQACNDDFCLLQSQVRVPAQIGQTFSVRVGSFLNQNTGIADAGPGKLTITCAPVPPNDTCQSANVRLLDVGGSVEFSGSNVNASADCNLLDGAQVWVAFDLQSTASVTVDYTGTTPVFNNAWANLIEGCPCASAMEAFPFQGSSPTDGNFVFASGCLQPGTYYYPILSEAGSQGDYDIAISAVPCDRCSGAQGDCLSEHPGIGCADAECCGDVCAADPFCCVVQWDDFCVQQANLLCGGLEEFCLMANGDCCAAQQQGVGGCGDVDCCVDVCQCDPFCCEVQWDADCATQGFGGSGCGAEVLCAQLCGGCPDSPIDYVDPPADWQDSRQPHELSDASMRQGVDTLVVSGPAGAESTDCWSLCETNQNANRHPGVVPNTITDVIVSGANEYTIVLAQPLTPGEITRLTLGESGANTLEYRVLPADVNGDGTAAPADILGVIDCLNGVAGFDCGLSRTDVDRSDEAGPPDILRVIDLLNGASAFEPWLDAALTDQPCP